MAGKNTKAAVTSFQKLCGLKNQSGDITSETITKLNSVYNRSQKGVLSRGLRNNASVKKLQENLNKLGFNCGTPDGTFGAGTETALRNFQKANKLTVDGLAGSATLNAINKEVEKLNKPNPNPGQYNTVTQEGIVYSKSKEGLSLKPYNNGKTIGYGMDIANFPDIKINYQKDGSITKQEADRLFEIVYNRFADKVNSYLDSKNIKLD
ncbi:MAG: peptidoglycan-binding protein [Lachnospiraceae bacterium]|nr:peptidoglycan-binding protein [Lachnospiraceae bacterium]